MADISIQLKTELLQQGADLVGFGSLSELPPDVRQSLPFGVAVAVKYPKEVIRGIHDLPTRDYFDHYHILNDRLDALAEFGAAFLQQKGFTAIPRFHSLALMLSSLKPITPLCFRIKPWLPVRGGVDRKMRVAGHRKLRFNDSHFLHFNGRAALSRGAYQ